MSTSKQSQNLDLRVGNLWSMMVRVCRVRVCRETRIWWSGVAAYGARRAPRAPRAPRARPARCCPSSEVSDTTHSPSDLNDPSRSPPNLNNSMQKRSELTYPMRPHPPSPRYADHLENISVLYLLIIYTNKFLFRIKNTPLKYLVVYCRYVLA